MNIKGIGGITSLIVISAVAIYIATLILKPEVNADKSDTVSVSANQPSLKPGVLPEAIPQKKTVAAETTAINSAETAEKIEGNAKKTVAKEVPPTAEEQQVIDEIDRLLGDDEVKTAVQLARRLMKSSNPDVRREAVDAFGWAGTQGLTELSEMLVDPDPDVAGDAFDNWESAAEDVEDEATQANVLCEGINKLTNSEDIESALMTFDSMENNVAVPAIVMIIQTGTPIAASSAREHYEFVTGETYKSPEVADAWVVQDMAE